MIIGFAGLTSCVAYQDGYADNNRYYDPYYSGGYYYAPSSYYGSGGYYGNDGYYYRDNMNYYYDNGVPYYVGRNNTKIYVVRQAGAGTSGNTNSATFRNSGTVQSAPASATNVRTRNTANQGFRAPNSASQTTARKESLRATTTTRTQTPAQAAQSQRGFRNTAPQTQSAPTAPVIRESAKQNLPAGTRGSR